MTVRNQLVILLIEARRKAEQARRSHPFGNQDSLCAYNRALGIQQGIASCVEAVDHMEVNA